MKKGRHRRYEEARAFKRSNDDDIESLFERLDDDPFDLPTTREAGMLRDEDSGNEDSGMPESVGTPESADEHED